MIRAAIVDDEINGRLFLRKLCEKFEPRVSVMAEAGNGIEALEILKFEVPDLIFLDIEMPRMSGIDFLKAVPEIPFEVVFVTAFNQYAVDAFRLGAVDYLLKPVNPEDLNEAINRVEQRIKQKQSSGQVKQLTQTYGQPFSRISIPTLNGFEFLDFKDIIYMESESNYTMIHLTSGKKITATRTLGDYEEMLDNHGFYRVHKSFLIRLEAIRKYIKGEGGTVVMEDGTEIDVARRKKEAFLERIKL